MGLKEQLKDTLPGPALCSLSDRFDVIGNIAVLSIPEELTRVPICYCGCCYLPAASYKDSAE